MGIWACRTRSILLRACSHLVWKPTLEDNPCLVTPLTILDPAQGQVEFAIDEGTSFGADVGQKHADLTVLDAPARATLLLLALGSRAGRVEESWCASMTRVPA
jgi:hypothetical protein